MSKNESDTIGVVIPDICDPFFCEVIKGISSVADKHGLKIILCDSDENPEKEVAFLENLKQLKAKGIIITPISDSNEFNSQYLKLLEQINNNSDKKEKAVKRITLIPEPVLNGSEKLFTK